MERKEKQEQKQVKSDIYRSLWVNQCSSSVCHSSRGVCVFGAFGFCTVIRSECDESHSRSPSSIYCVAEWFTMSHYGMYMSAHVQKDQGFPHTHTLITHTHTYHTFRCAHSHIYVTVAVLLENIYRVKLRKHSALRERERRIKKCWKFIMSNLTLPICSIKSLFLWNNK